MEQFTGGEILKPPELGRRISYFKYVGNWVDTHIFCDGDHNYLCAAINCQVTMIEFDIVKPT